MTSWILAEKEKLPSVWQQFFFGWYPLGIHNIIQYNLIGTGSNVIHQSYPSHHIRCFQFFRYTLLLCHFLYQIFRHITSRSINTQYRGLAQVTNRVKLKFAAMNLKKWLLGNGKNPSLWKKPRKISSEEGLSYLVWNLKWAFSTGCGVALSYAPEQVAVWTLWEIKKQSVHYRILKSYKDTLHGAGKGGRTLTNHFTGS